MKISKFFKQINHSDYLDFGTVLTCS